MDALLAAALANGALAMNTWPVTVNGIDGTALQTELLVIPMLTPTSFTTDSWGTYDIAFPTPFPNAYCGALVTPQWSDSENAIHVGVYALGTPYSNKNEVRMMFFDTTTGAPSTVATFNDQVFILAFGF